MEIFRNYKDTVQFFLVKFVKLLLLHQGEEASRSQFSGRIYTNPMDMSEHVKDLKDSPGSSM